MKEFRIIDNAVRNGEVIHGATWEEVVVVAEEVARIYNKNPKIPFISIVEKDEANKVVYINRKNWSR